MNLERLLNMWIISKINCISVYNQQTVGNFKNINVVIKKYLGVNLEKHMQGLYIENYKKLLRKIKT